MPLSESCQPYDSRPSFLRDLKLWLEGHEAGFQVQVRGVVAAAVGTRVVRSIVRSATFSYVLSSAS